MNRVSDRIEGRNLLRWLWLVSVAALLAACNPQDPAGAPADLLAMPDQAFVAATATTTPAATPDLSDAELIQQGQALYTVNCAPCHRPNGEGNLSYFPALSGNPLVTAQPPTALISTVQHGRQEMPAFASALSDLELASILSYIRNAWGNSAPVIRPDQINAP